MAQTNQNFPNRSQIGRLTLLWLDRRRVFGSNAKANEQINLQKTTYSRSENILASENFERW